MTGPEETLLKVSQRRTPWAIFFTFVAATLLRGTAEFRYDALWYSLAAQRVVGTVPHAPEGFWQLRGLLTAFVYVPASLLSGAAGPETLGFAVLLQNALFLAYFAAFLLPRIIARWTPTSTTARWIGAGLAWVVTAGFAPYPLVDIYPAVGCLAMIAALRSQRRYALLLAGILGGASINLRPAYIVTVALLILVALVWRRWVALLVPAGVLIALVPQAAFNLVRFNILSVLPPSSAGLVGLQASLASYIVRYDTLFGAAQPQQFYCSPAMASHIDGLLPTTTGGLASTYLGELPTSLLFALQKVGAALHWPLSTPYTIPMPGLDALFAVVITAIAVVGIAALVRLAISTRHRLASHDWYDWAGIATVAVGSVLTLISAATENRFALPLVLLGVVGCTTLANASARRPSIRDWRWIAGTLVIILGIIGLGYGGLSHPAPAGVWDQATCAAL